MPVKLLVPRSNTQIWQLLTSSAVIPSIVWGGCYVLKTVTPSESQSAATAVSLPSVLRGAEMPMHVHDRQWTMSVVVSISHSQWSVATDKIIFPSIRLPDIICVELVYQHHKLQCIQLHWLTAAIGAAAVLWVQVQWEHTVERSSVHLNFIRRMSQWTHHGRYMYRFQTETLSKFIPPRRLINIINMSTKVVTSAEK